MGESWARELGAFIAAALPYWLSFLVLLLLDSLDVYDKYLRGWLRALSKWFPRLPIPRKAVDGRRSSKLPGLIIRFLTYMALMMGAFAAYRDVAREARAAYSELDQELRDKEQDLDRMRRAADASSDLIEALQRDIANVETRQGLLEELQDERNRLREEALVLQREVGRLSGMRWYVRNGQSDDGPYVKDVIFQPHRTISPATIAVRCDCNLSVAKVDFIFIDTAPVLTPVLTGYVLTNRGVTFTVQSPRLTPFQTLLVRLVSSEPISNVEAGPGPN